MYEPPAANWYPDPADASLLRYWDGHAWTEHRAPLPVSHDFHKRGVKFKPSKPLVESTYRLLMADKAMVGLLFAGAIVSAAVAMAIEIPAIHWGLTPSWSTGGPMGLLVAGLAMGASSFVIQLTTGAVVASAMMRAEGRAPSVRGSLAMAWARRRQLLAWALVSTGVGAASRLLERFGIGGLIARLAVDLGWAVATVFAMPVVMVEGTMPVATVRRSAQLLKAHFAATIISNLRLAIPWVLGMVAALTLAFTGGLWLAFGAGDVTAIALGSVMLATGVIAFFFCAVVSAALRTYLETLLYRYALDLAVPGIDPGLLPTRRPTA